MNRVLPDSLILDLGDAVVEFERQVERTNPYGATYVCEVLDTFFNDCLREDRSALESLNNFVEEVRYAHHMQARVGVDIYPEHADAVANLGKYVYAHLKHIGAYDQNGELPYSHNLDFAVYHNEVVLFRNNEDTTSIFDFGLTASNPAV